MSKLFIMHSIGLNDVLSYFKNVILKNLYMMYKHIYNFKKIAIYSKEMYLMSAIVSNAHVFALSHEECDNFT